MVLLSPPDMEEAVSERVCGLGASLCAQALSVSVDLWSRAELCSLGPLPWLHSQLQRLHSQGGRVVLVLTHAACKRAEEWTLQDRDRAQPEDRGEVEDKELLQDSSPYSDVFSTALNCIKADNQQGHTGERFLLVHFESHPALPTGRERGLPDLFQGLPLFHLPSQSQALLSELAMGAKAAGGARKHWRTERRGRGLHKDCQKTFRI